jgi:hypothetical protein
MFLHHLDLGTSTDTPVVLDGRHLHLNTIRRSPSGRLAVIWAVYQIALLDYESRHLETIYDNPTNTIIENLQWWTRPTRGTARLLYSLFSAGVLGEQLDVAGGQRAPFPLGWHYTHLMSPDGNTMVVGGIDPITRVGVLNLMSPDDISGASVRHLTSFSPP